MSDRTAQALECSDWIARTSRAACSDVAVLAGDLNTEPGDLPFRVLRGPGRMRGLAKARNEVEDAFFPTFGHPDNSYTGCDMANMLHNLATLYRVSVLAVPVAPRWTVLPAAGARVPSTTCSVYRTRGGGGGGGGESVGRLK